MKTIEKKKFKKLTHLAIALSLEKEELKELDMLYGGQFVNDFREEELFCTDRSKNGEKMAGDHGHEIDTTFPKIESGPAKFLHRKLAMLTHPDITGDELAFKRIQSAYEEGDLAEMLIASLELGVDVDMTLEDLTILESQIDDQRASLVKIKSTARWAWAQSNKSDKMRRTIQEALGIDPKAFFEWQKNQPKS